MSPASNPMMRMVWVVSALLVVMALAVLAGCGGSTSTPSSTSSSNSSSEPDPASTPSSQKGGGTSSEFISPGGENKYAKFGEEASDEEREAASRILTESLEARQAGEFEAQCSTLSKAPLEELAAGSGAPVGLTGQALVEACGKGLKKLATPLSGSAEVRKNTLSGEIAVLRVKGKKGYALYHGTEGADYAMPMEKEGLGWKVAALVTLEVP